MESFTTDRSGQIIVVAALLLAVVFVGLALVLNSAIYAENLATRGETTTGEAMAVEDLTGEHLQEAIDAENYGIEEDTYAARRARLGTNVSEWNDVMGPKEARTGNSYSVELTGMTSGTRVNQSDPTRDFKPASSTVLDANPLGLLEGMNWQVAVDSRVRAYEMTVRRDSLKDAGGGPTAVVEDLIDGLISGTYMFWTRFDGPGGTHRMYLLDDSDNNSVAVVVTLDDGSGETVVGACRASAPDPSDYVTVRITDAELEGAGGTVNCPPLADVDEGRQDVYYAGSDDVQGTYRFLADRQEGPFRTDIRDAHDILLGISLTDGDVYADSPSDTDPYTTTAVYGITVESTYRDGQITYVRNATFPETAR